MICGEGSADCKSGPFVVDDTIALQWKDLARTNKISRCDKAEEQRVRKLKRQKNTCRSARCGPYLSARKSTKHSADSLPSPFSEFPEREAKVSCRINFRLCFIWGEVKEVCGRTYPPLGSASAWYAGRPSSLAPKQQEALVYSRDTIKTPSCRYLPVQNTSTKTPFSSA